MRSALLVAALSVVLSACSPRLELISAYHDPSGNELYTFRDSIFIARIGSRANEQFNRRMPMACGRIRAMGEGIALRSLWPEQVEVTAVCDTILSSEKFLVTICDEQGLNVGLSTGAMWSVIETSGASMFHDLGYNCFVANDAQPWVRVVDEWDGFRFDTVRFRDATCMQYQLRMPFRFYELNDVELVLRDYVFERTAMGFEPAGVYSGNSQQDPRFGVLVPWTCPEDLKRGLEQDAWRVKHCGHLRLYCPR